MAHVNNPDWIGISLEELERFDLICSICYNVFLDPVQTDNDNEDPCGHVFCRSCITQWLQTNSECPNCRSPLTIDQLRIDARIRRQVQHLPVVCHIDPKVCLAKGKLGKDQKWWNQHDKVCPYKYILCPICTITCQRHELKKHISECPNAFTECIMGCGAPVKRKYIQKHITQCPFRMVACSQCSKLHPQRKLEKHIKISCSKTKIKCMYNSVGCAFWHLRDDIEAKREHMENNLKNHLFLTTKALITLDKLPPENTGQEENEEDEEVLQLCQSFFPKNAQEEIVSGVLAKGFGGEWGIAFGWKAASEGSIPLYIWNFNRTTVSIEHSISLMDPISGEVLKTIHSTDGPMWETHGKGWHDEFKRSEYPVLDKTNIILVVAHIKLAPNERRNVRKF